MTHTEYDDWINSPEYKQAWEAWRNDMLLLSQGEAHVPFVRSEPFRNARLAYRRRINASPSAETT